VLPCFQLEERARSVGCRTVAALPDQEADAPTVEEAAAPPDPEADAPAEQEAAAPTQEEAPPPDTNSNVTEGAGDGGSGGSAWQGLSLLHFSAQRHTRFVGHAEWRQ